MPTGLQRRNGRYNIRRRVPADLIAVFGKVEITRTLSTADPAEARRLLPLAWHQLTVEFDETRKAIASHANAQSEHGATRKSVDVDEYADKAFAALRKRRDEAASAGTLSAFSETLRDDLAWHQSAIDHGPLIVGGETAADALAKAEGARNATRALLTGEPLVRVRSHPKRTGSDITLMAVWEKWANERKPKARAVEAHKRVVERLEASVGGTAFAGMERTELLAFKDDLLKSGQTPANINALLSRLNTLFNFAIKNALATENPVRGLSVVDRQRRRDKRREWTVENLNRLFASRLYTEGYRPVAAGGPAGYWLPILALFTGARLSELGQLAPTDIHLESYVTAKGALKQAWVIRFDPEPDSDQSIKNEGSIRRVPIHADVAALGFLDFVEAAKRSGRTRLFDEIRPGTKELMGGWSKWFGRYRKAIGVGAKEIPFHALRHSFKHYARLSEIPSDKLNELTGHESGETGDDYGGLNFPLPSLIRAMSQYRVPGLVLPKPDASVEGNQLVE